MNCKKLLQNKVVRVALVSIVFLVCMIHLQVQAQEQISGDEGSTPSVRDSAVQMPSHVGDSPFTPPEPTDNLFIVDEGMDLDTGCLFRDEGPIIFEILIDRFPGDIDKLIANGLAKEMARLRMPAYDVDFVASRNVSPERDRVWFNDQVVPTEFLRGENNTWILNDFEIPLQWIKFATLSNSGGPPTPGVNIIRIDIDTANTTREWCTAIDWATLSVEVAQPVLLVHGIRSDNTTWDQTDPAAFKWSPVLGNLGIPFSKIDMGRLESIQENATLIGAAVNTLRQKWGVDKLTIIAHSKGGLDSRHYAEQHDTISRIIQVGTPNAGSPLADAIQAGLITAIGGVNSAIIDTLVGEASYQLTTPYMNLYNLFHGPNPDTSYISLAGNYKYGGWGIWDTTLENFYGGDNDTIVPVASVHALRYALHPKLSSMGEDKSAEHTFMTRSQRIYDDVLPFLRPFSQPSAISVLRSVQVQATSLFTYQAIKQPIQTSTIVNTISQGQTHRHTFFMDSAQSITFILYYGTGNLEFSLNSPSGMRITPTTANATIEFDTFGDSDGIRFKTYTITSPETGSWLVEVLGTTVTNPSGSEPYFVAGWLADSSIQMSATTDQAIYQLDDAVIVQSTILNETAPVLNAQVKAKIVFPDEDYRELALADNGMGDDAAAGDGIYTGRLNNAPQAGLYRLLVSASKTSGPVFTREQLLSFPVSTGRSTIQASFADSGQDLNGDGLFEELAIDVDVNVTNADLYRLIGILADTSGLPIATAVTEPNLLPGIQTVRLTFDGSQIFQHGLNGPYVLSLLRLAEINPFSPLPLDEQVNVYSTSAYMYTQFQGSAIAIPGTGTDEGIDDNSDGQFDKLEVKLNVLVKNAGVYHWSARLVDDGGAELGVLADSAGLSSGLNVITFHFDGRSIGENGTDGPYHLIDLLMYGNQDSAVVFQAYTTAGYNASHFVGYVPQWQVGDCNADQSIGASDLTALALEFFDGDDNNNLADIANGSFAGSPACDANQDSKIGASDLTCIGLIFFNGPNACGAGVGAAAGTPVLAIPDGVTATAGSPVAVPVTLQGNGSQVTSLLFSLDYDERWLSFDPADHDEDGLPDAISLTVPSGYVRSVTFDPTDSDGELDIVLASFASPPAPLSDGVLATVTLTAGVPSTTTTAAIQFATQPLASFGDHHGRELPGVTDDGSLLINPPNAGLTPTLYLPLIRQDR